MSDGRLFHQIVPIEVCAWAWCAPCVCVLRRVAPTIKSYKIPFTPLQPRSMPVSFPAPLLAWGNYCQYARLGTRGAAVAGQG